MDPIKLKERDIVYPTYQTLVKDILTYPWFKPDVKIQGSLIEELVRTHQERFRPFGFVNVCPCQMIKIWPGKTPKEILELRAESKKSLIFMFIGNALEIMREMAIDSRRMSVLDMVARDLESKVKIISGQHAIESSGLTAKETVSLPIVAANAKITDFIDAITDKEIADKASDDAMATTGWHVSWLAVEEFLKQQKNYLNPFSPLMKMYKLGLWPIGIVKNEYIVLIPGGRRTQIV